MAAVSVKGLLIQRNITSNVLYTHIFIFCISFAHFLTNYTMWAVRLRSSVTPLWLLSKRTCIGYWDLHYGYYFRKIAPFILYLWIPQYTFRFLKSPPQPPILHKRLFSNAFGPQDRIHIPKRIWNFGRPGIGGYIMGRFP